ncbi:SMP-30/gluconolactonase/LRE family protein [Oryzibacter oryziterrae]|uniref:SMP-30/gluconolactonase/LRE family protein n=1 Tax=Oryzibacter oryziterrae TaxID=2766474 RepID=UPI001F4649DF|nr:hypothetical protein [Oryzibacter oryziterrae]
MWWDRFLDPFRGKAVTIPPLDGALRPNSALETAIAFAEVDRPAAIVAQADRLVVASHEDLLAIRLDGSAPRSIRRFDGRITALAAFADGGLVVALESGELHCLGGRQDGRVITRLGDHKLICPTALATAGDHMLFVAEGSTSASATDWIGDLMRKGASGSLWRLDLSDGEATELAHGLAWPAGILVEPDHSLIVAEASRHCLTRVAADGRGRRAVILADIAGYPANLSRAADGGAWLAVMAPRNRLVEFVLQEDAYRAEMIETIDREFWIAPQMTSANSFLEPLQCGGVVVMGVRKPWAPARSYGLVVKLDGLMRPQSSLHSRADGRRHGVRQVVEAGGALYVASNGGNLILKVEGDA